MTFEIDKHKTIIETNGSFLFSAELPMSSQYQYWRLEGDVEPYLGISDDERGLIELDVLAISSEMSCAVERCVTKLLSIRPNIRSAAWSGRNSCRIDSNTCITVLHLSDIDILGSTIVATAPRRNKVVFRIAVIALDQEWEEIAFGERQLSIATIRKLGFVPLFCPPGRHSTNVLAMTVLSLCSLPFIDGSPCLDHYDAGYRLNSKKSLYAISRFVKMTEPMPVLDFSRDIEPNHNAAIVVVWADDTFELDQYEEICESIGLFLNEDADFAIGTKLALPTFQTPFARGATIFSSVPL